MGSFPTGEGSAAQRDSPGADASRLLELWKRSNDAGIRFVNAQIEKALSLLATVEASPHARDRSPTLREAREALDCAARFVHVLFFPDSQEAEVMDRIQALREQISQLSAVSTARARRDGNSG